MSISLITGNHPRHHFLANELIKTGKVCCWVIEIREEFVPQPPSDLNLDLVNLFRFHFSERDRIEQEVFGHSVVVKPSVPVLKVHQNDLNSDRTIEFIAQNKPRLVLSYGCHKIGIKMRESVNAQFWNTHGGLSPEYRGVITHFWPSFFLEPQMTGVTLHETTDELDGGAIVLQTSAAMVRGDTLHRLAARNIEHYVVELIRQLEILDFENIPNGIKQRRYGRVFMSQDWRPEHLRVIYETHSDKIVDDVLDGKIKGRQPNLISSFD